MVALLVLNPFVQPFFRLLLFSFLFLDNKPYTSREPVIYIFIHLLFTMQLLNLFLTLLSVISVAAAAGKLKQ